MADAHRIRRPHNFNDLTGRKFARLFVVRYHGQSAAKKSVWWCRCDCGVEKSVVGGALASGLTRSCGCLERELTVRRNQERALHGMTDSPEWKTWKGMIERCCNSKARSYRHYGEQGVQVFQGWRDSFQAFFDHVGPRPSAKHSIDRHPDPNGNYEPGNVRWATSVEQVRNRRTTKRFLFQGESLVITEISERTGVSYKLIWDRLRMGWPIERAASQEARTYHNRKET